MDIKGIPTELWVRVSRKRSDDNYGSYGVEAELKINLANVQDLNLDDTFDAVDAWLTAAVAKSMKAKTAPEAPALQPEQAATVAETSTEAGFGPPAVESLASEPPPPPPTESPPPPPSAPQASGPVETHEILDNCTISHQVTGSGIHHLLVKGGKYTKFGIKMWPEKASEFIQSEWQEWPIGKDYGLPDGYSEAVIQMKPDGKPDRVVGLR